MSNGNNTTIQCHVISDTPKSGFIDDRDRLLVPPTQFADLETYSST